MWIKYWLFFVSVSQNPYKIFNIHTFSFVLLFVLCIIFAAYQMCDRRGMAGDHAGMFTQPTLWERVDQRKQHRQWGLRQPVCHHLLCQLLHALCLFGETNHRTKKDFLFFLITVPNSISDSCCSADHQSVCGCNYGQLWLPDTGLVDPWTTPSWWIQKNLGGIRPRS